MKSNLGYQLILEYASSNSNAFTKACVFNAAVITPPSGDTCPTGVQTATYAYSGGSTGSLTSSTNPVGGTSTIGYPSGQISYTRPGDTQPWLVNIGLTGAGGGGFRPGTGMVVGQQQFTSGPTIVYAYNDNSEYVHDGQGFVYYGRGVGWTVNSTATTTLEWGFDDSAIGDPTPPARITPGPTTVTDPLSRITSMTYAGGPVPYSVMLSQTAPSGIQQQFTYGSASGAITQATTVGTGGVGNLVKSWTFNCTTLACRIKPTSMTDARGGVTDYTYDTTHGGMLTETLPAAPNGVRPQKRYTWSQYTASWSGGTGTVWLLSSISQCQTTASCTGTADEVVTTLAYNTTMNLLPSSQTVTSNGTSLTTAWTHDSSGNKLSEDGPMAGTTDTRYWRYDAMRRVTGTIAPDPDGAGSLPNPAVRNTYDTAGRLTKVENGSLTSVPAATVAPSAWSGFTVYTSLETTYDIQSRKLTETMKGSDSVAASLTQYSYDSFGRLECTATRMNPAVYGSLPSSACTMGTAGSFGPDRITKNVYDLAGQLLQVREGVGSAVESAEATYSYTPNGLKQQIVDANGNRAELRYDGFDRQVRWVFPSGTRASAYNDATPALAMSSANALNEGDYESYGYDANGNRTILRKRDATELNYTYDALNRMTVKDVPGRGDLDPSTTRDVYYGYDLLGRQLYARFDSASGEGVTNTFDGFGRQLSQRTTFRSLDQTVSYQYDAAGNRTRLTWPDGRYANYNYDALSRPTYTVLDNLSSGLFGYNFNAAGYNTISSRGQGYSFPYYTSQEYDAAGGMFAIASYTATPALNPSRAFTFNPAGQKATTSTTTMPTTPGPVRPTSIAITPPTGSTNTARRGPRRSPTTLTAI